MITYRPRRRASPSCRVQPGAQYGPMDLLAFVLLLAAPARAGSPVPYWPAEDWQRRTPAQVGMSAARIDEAIAFARANESAEPRDLERAHDVGDFGREPYSHSTGPFRPRGEPTGIVVRHGYVVAEWGEPDRVDMTFSVTKSFLSSVIGVAVDRGLIRSVDDPVAPAMAPILDRAGRMIDPFSSPHARTI